MLQAASSTLGWSVSKTSSLAGELYNSGHVTYIRTDSTRTNQGARETVKNFVKDKFGHDYLGEGVLDQMQRKEITTSKMLMKLSDQRGRR